MFGSLLIANRGEIACRIIRSAQALGIHTIAIHSEQDSASKHVRIADTAINLGASPAAQNYLNADAIIEAAVKSGAEAIHPGYGFLAENSGFVRKIEDAGLIFVGPNAEAISSMGEKVTARSYAVKAEVPLAPGSDGTVETTEEILAFGAEYGYPILVKASYGGGGRGMRRVNSAEEVAEQFEAARREATAAFGNGDVYVERYLVNARHVEVQILADAHGKAFWLGDRDCSVQRRHQKLVEEAPAPGLSDETRRQMGEASVRLAEAVGYRGAGTVEFLLEGDQFYFLEMNTRIQVEHTITEEVLGIDLVTEQLKIAAGEESSISRSGLPVNGVAIEARINAEDVSDGQFFPAPGRIDAIELPEVEGLRFDTGYDAGDTVLPDYDSLIGKVIVHADTREEAINKLIQVLRTLNIEGVPTTANVIASIIDHADFRAVEHGTLWLETAIDINDLLEPPLGRQEVEVLGRMFTIPVFPDKPTVGGAPGGSVQPAERTQTGRGRRAKRTSKNGPTDGKIVAPMQGTITNVAVTVGAEVNEGDLLFVLEAMKMENPVKAPVSGTVQEILVSTGEAVAAGTELAKVS